VGIVSHKFETQPDRSPMLSQLVLNCTNCHALHHELKNQDKSAPIQAMDFEHYKCLSHVGSVFKIIYRK
jgi:hypothetical protein